MEVWIVWAVAVVLAMALGSISYLAHCCLRAWQSDGAPPDDEDDEAPPSVWGGQG